MSLPFGRLSFFRVPRGKVPRRGTPHERLFIKAVPADGESKWTVVVHPEVGGDGFIHEIKNIIAHRRPFEDHFRRTAAFIVGIVVDPAIGGRRELHAVFFFENDTVDGVWE